jgi:hypothetical protein
MLGHQKFDIKHEYGKSGVRITQGIGLGLLKLPLSEGCFDNIGKSMSVVRMS